MSYNSVNEIQDIIENCEFLEFCKNANSFKKEAKQALKAKFNLKIEFTKIESKILLYIPRTQVPKNS